MLDVIKEANLKPVDVAKLLNVSRVTVSLWLNGHKKPHRLLHNRVELLTKAVKAAIGNGSLPVSPDTKRADRFDKVKEAIRTELHDMDLDLNDVSG